MKIESFKELKRLADDFAAALPSGTPMPSEPSRPIADNAVYRHLPSSFQLNEESPSLALLVRCFSLIDCYPMDKYDFFMTELLEYEFSHGVILENMTVQQLSSVLSSAHQKMTAATLAALAGAK